MNILKGKPAFELKIDYFGVSFFVLFNGSTVFFEYDSFGQASLNIPLNLWMRPDKNNLRLEVLPDEVGGIVNPNAHVSVELWVNQSGSNDRHKISSIVFVGGGISNGPGSVENSCASGRFSSSEGFARNENGDVIVSEVKEIPLPDYDGAFSYERDLNLPSSLPLWAFFRSEDLPDYDSMPDDEYFSARDDLFRIYKMIQDSLVKGDVDSVVLMAAERNVETDKAFYLEPGTTERKLKESLMEAINNENLQLVELKSEGVQIRLEDNRKLVRLVRAQDTSAIAFGYKSFSGSQRYNFVFRRENDRWILAR